MAPQLFSDLGKRAEKLFELPVKAGFQSKTTWYAEQEQNGQINIGYESPDILSGGGGPKGLFVQWMAVNDPSGIKFVELRPGGHHKIKGNIPYNEDCSFDFDFEDSDSTEEPKDRHVARVGCTIETDMYAVAASVDLLDDSTIAKVSAVTSPAKHGQFLGCSLNVSEVSPEVQADIELACGQAKGGAWWRYHMNTDTALNFAGCTLEAIQSFKVRSKHYLHDVSMGGRVVVADQRTLTCEYAGRMQVDDFTVASGTFGVDSLTQSPSITASVVYSLSPTIKIGALVGGSAAGFSNLGLAFDFDIV